MHLRPLLFGFLFHHIVPGVYFFGLELVKNVVWRAGKIQESRLLDIQRADDLLGEVSLCAFVRFVDDDKIPFGLEHIFVLLQGSVSFPRLTQVLHGGKEDEVLATLL